MNVVKRGSDPSITKIGKPLAQNIVNRATRNPARVMWTYTDPTRNY